MTATGRALRLVLVALTAAVLLAGTLAGDDVDFPLGDTMLATWSLYLPLTIGRLLHHRAPTYGLAMLYGKVRPRPVRLPGGAGCPAHGRAGAVFSDVAFELSSPVVLFVRSDRIRYAMVAGFYVFHVMTFAALTIVFLLLAPLRRETKPEPAQVARL